MTYSWQFDEDSALVPLREAAHLTARTHASRRSRIAITQHRNALGVNA
jgi:hypothetical protein